MEVAGLPLPPPPNQLSDIENLLQSNLCALEAVRLKDARQALAACCDEAGAALLPEELEEFWEDRLRGWDRLAAPPHQFADASPLVIEHAGSDGCHDFAPVQDEVDLHIPGLNGLEDGLRIAAFREGLEVRHPKPDFLHGTLERNAEEPRSSIADRSHRSALLLCIAPGVMKGICHKGGVVLGNLPGLPHVLLVLKEITVDRQPIRPALLPGLDDEVQALTGLSDVLEDVGSYDIGKLTQTLISEGECVDLVKPLLKRIGEGLHHDQAFPSAGIASRRAVFPYSFRRFRAPVA
ncbi:hypothetical protein KBI52_12310 [Microvirga sp. HBU67558]|uniref:hypothetical protein n=1 Tax=Microvirga sp. HBU67558 TaxID=2824562 RepID=UPI001B372AB0|nr:hypothetical protein [Microvirga sp. HBU67558]MBQ0820990.1 hypothetical protein [Microvirga sp. HBU67558]